MISPQEENFKGMKLPLKKLHFLGDGMRVNYRSGKVRLTTRHRHDLPSSCFPPVNFWHVHVHNFVTKSLESFLIFFSSRRKTRISTLDFITLRPCLRAYVHTRSGIDARFEELEMKLRLWSSEGPTANYFPPLFIVALRKQPPNRPEHS